MNTYTIKNDPFLGTITFDVIHTELLGDGNYRDILRFPNKSKLAIREHSSIHNYDRLIVLTQNEINTIASL